MPVTRMIADHGMPSTAGFCTAGFTRISTRAITKEATPTSRAKTVVSTSRATRPVRVTRRMGVTATLPGPSPEGAGVSLVRGAAVRTPLCEPAASASSSGSFQASSATRSAAVEPSAGTGAEPLARPLRRFMIAWTTTYASTARIALKSKQ